MKRKLKYPRDFHKIDDLHFSEETISEFATDILLDLKTTTEPGFISTREIDGGDTRIQGEKRGNHIQIDVYRSVERYETTIEAADEELSGDIDMSVVETVNTSTIAHKSLIKIIIDFIKKIFGGKNV